MKTHHKTASQKNPAHKNVDTLGDFNASYRLLTISLMAIVVGAMGTGAAWMLQRLINLVTNLAYAGQWSTGNYIISSHPLSLYSILIPVAGCLIIGFMARYGSEKIRGHGIPEAIEAILIGKSRISPKVAFLKPLSSAISIGTGGPFGAEGPIIMTGGALGSIFAQMFHLTSSERKTLLVAGAAAGMSATFNTPIAAMLLAVELLLFEWRPQSFIPVSIAATVAAALRAPLLGAGALFPMPAAEIALTYEVFLACAAVGVLSGLLSGLLTQMVYGFEDFFQRLPIHWMWWPVLGGLAIGIGGWIEPHALGVGYDNIAALIRGDMTNHEAAHLLVFKALIWAIALGSGTSGGVLAPLLMMGGCMGALLNGWLPAEAPGLWALLGMAAVMGGTMRSPLTAIIFALGLTHNVEALLPLAIACTVAQGTTVLLLKRSILTEKIARRGYHIFREYEVDPFELTRAMDIMTPCTREASHALLRGLDPDKHVTGYTDEMASYLMDRLLSSEAEYVVILDRKDESFAGILCYKDLLKTRSKLLQQVKEREVFIPILKRHKAAAVFPIDRD
jgi:CIC family chloride channel protein